MNKNIIIAGLGVIVAFVVGVGYFAGDKDVTPDVSVKDNVAIGAFSGPDIFADRLSFNGVDHLYFNSRLQQSTTTVCSFFPRATSTLIHASITFFESTSTSDVVEIGKGTTNTATSTVFGGAFNVASDAQASIYATTTIANNDSQDLLFTPLEYLVINRGGSATNDYTLLGFCNAEFIAH